MDPFNVDVFNGSNDYTLDDIIKNFEQGYNNCSVLDAMSYSTSGVFYKINDTIRADLLQIAPENAKLLDGSLACSDEIQLTYIVGDDGGLILDVKIGIEVLFKLRHELVVDTSYIQKMTQFCMMSLDDETSASFDILKGILTTGPKTIELANFKTRDRVQTAYEHSLNSIASEVVGNVQDHADLVLFDPSPGSVTRMASVSEVELTNSPSVDYEAVRERSFKEGKRISGFHDTDDKRYYLGFYDRPLKPKHFFGFEVNPYSNYLRSSCRVKTVSTVLDHFRNGHDIVYDRNGVTVNHHFAAFPNYFRYKTRVTVPFFQSHNKKFQSAMNDMYLFYSSDPFVKCFDYIVPFSGKRELFPIGLRNTYSFDASEVVDVACFGKIRKITFYTQKGVYVDFESHLSFVSRRVIFDMLLSVLNKPPPEKFPDLKLGRMEHPISGDCYDRVKLGCKLDMDEHLCTLIDANQNESSNISEVVKYSDNKGVEFPITKDDVFLTHDSGLFRHGKVKIGVGDDYCTIKGIVPGSPVGFLVGNEGKRNYFSVIKGVKNAIENYSELDDYYQNCIWFKSYKYVYADIVKYKADQDSVKVGGLHKEPDKPALFSSKDDLDDEDLVDSAVMSQMDPHLIESVRARTGCTRLLAVQALIRTHGSLDGASDMILSQIQRNEEIHSGD